MRSIKLNFNLKYIIPVPLLFFFFFSCLSLKVEIPDEPDEIAEYMIILDSIDENTDLSELKKDNDISIKNDAVFSLIKVLNISGKRSLRWFWYDPGDNLVRTSPAITINRDNKFLEYFIAWDDINRDLFFNKEGKWRIIVKLDDKFLALKDFILK